MNLYNVDDEKLTNLNITSHVIMNIEYFWTDERVRRLCQAIQNLDDIQINLDLFQQNIQQCQGQDLALQLLINVSNISAIQHLQTYWNSPQVIGEIKIITSLTLLSFIWERPLQIQRSSGQIFNSGDTRVARYQTLGQSNYLRAFHNKFRNWSQILTSMIDKISRLGYRNQNITGHSFVAMGDFIEKLENLKNLTLNLADWGNDYNKSLELFYNEDLQYLIEKIFTLELEKLHLDLTGLGMNGSKITEESAFFLLQHLQLAEIYDLNIVLQGWICDVGVKNQILKMAKEKQQLKKQMYQLLAFKSLEVSTQDRMLEDIFAKL
ncbi:unnamed protein product (macronuclear) [Paramecium tetraurelia]|uniref:Uncharacterized protein n=1 Tax=Paramecium tetraurelia TaxID=5888 RepID=A0CYG5_PARTE|nr:uncharacterized protein GSPATT00011432001 [Paramecium tetraurelia]CAK75832.1 unnamed protein product [Paramecium tetraurelia]|eukprot:XP_001443229.1 hypothetical protein (macronuclear) [Paramecium tetraurelia strain d4-2]